jgi:gamma-glutamyltranspeptidase/glutathione hydrolase
VEKKWAAPTTRPTIRGTTYMVSAGHYAATLVASRILDAGGNAIDAGVAAGMCLNIVQPDMTNLGGVAPILISHAKTGRVSTLSGLGAWPKRASIEYFIENHGGRIPPGIMRTVVPAAIGAWLTALEKYGTKTFAEVAAPVIELARNGFQVTTVMNDSLNDPTALKAIREWPSTAKIYLDPDGRPLDVGTLQKQEDTARFLERLAAAEKGADSREAGIRAAYDLFYKGEIAQQIAGFAQSLGGWMTVKDLASFEVEEEEALKVEYRGYEIYGCGPWCQGPLILQTMNILEGYDFSTIEHGSAEFYHLVLEALKAAFADRDRYYGDPRFVDVPIAGLLSKEYAATWRDRISLNKASAGMPAPGNAWDFDPNPDPGTSWTFPTPEPGWDEPDTSYVCVVDSEGNAFSATPSDGVMGAPIVDGLGIIMSGRGSQSWLDAHHPAALAPGKRPRLTPNPGLVKKGNEFLMPYGTPGLDVQPQAMAQFLVGLLDYGLDVQDAIERPRVATYSYPGSSDPHPYRPGLVKAESRISPEVIDRLTALGHKVELWPEWSGIAGSLSAAVRDRTTGTLAGGADPRRVAYALGW